MIDSDGYRPNVGIIVANNAGQVLWTKRIGRSGWQFPQGGINTGEKAEDALYRELEEEIGLRAEHVKIIRCTDGWLRYKLPKRYLREKATDFIGQKQKWFLLKMLAEDHCVRFDRSATPEFESWQWVSYWYPLSQVVTFKKDVYLRAMKALAPGIASCITPP